MSPLFRKKRVLSRPAKIAIIDIGSGSVGAALAEIAPEKRPTVLAHKRLALPLLAHRTAVTLEAGIFRVLGDALAGLMKGRRHSLDHIAIFVPAPWSALRFTVLRFARKEAFAVSEKLVRQMIAEHVNYHEREAIPPRKNSAHAALPIFERVIAGIKLNGYVSAALPKNAKAVSIKVILAEASAPVPFLDKLTSLVREHCGSAGLTMHSTALAAAHAVVRLTGEQSFLLCDGEGELAELLMINETIPEAHATIPVGFSTIMRTIALHGGLTSEELPSALALIAEGNSPLAGQSAEAIALAQNECEGALGAAQQLYLHAAPSVCFMIGEGPEAQWFAQALERSPQLKAVLPPGFRTQMITTASLGSAIGFAAPSRRKAGDAMMGLEALFAADRFGNPEVQYFYL